MQYRTGFGATEHNREVVMRRILFPSLGAVLLLLAYAGQEFGHRSTLYAEGFGADPGSGGPNRQRGQVLKHITVATERLLESRAPVDPKTRQLAKAILRKEALVEQKADKIIADAHKARTAQLVPEAEQEVEGGAIDLSITGRTLTQEAKQEFVRLQTE